MMVVRGGARFDAVVFDLGGVVLDSPMHVIGDYERENGIEPGSINRIVFSGGPRSVWARHERGEVCRGDFLQGFADELGRHGLRVDTGALMDRIEASFRTRPQMVRAIQRLRSAGLAVAAITNNWTPFPEDGLPALFDVFVESVVEGVRKPERLIYERCVDRLGLRASRMVMLDDLGPNLKPARAMGMTTIKVMDPDRALSDLSQLIAVAFD